LRLALFRLVLFRVALLRVAVLRPARFRPVLLRAELARPAPVPRRFRVAAALRAEADLAAFGRRAAARPPFFPPFLDGAVFFFLPRPEPLFLPPPVSALTVAHARRSASLRPVPRFS
jgi:hypothetical protein